MFGSGVAAAAKRHALIAYPDECCGVVTGGVYVPLDNVADDPRESFQLPARALVDHDPVQAVVHSHCHPRHRLVPTAADMAAQMELRVPFGIALSDGHLASDLLWWGDHRLDDPLLGRSFVHGVSDCYGLIRSEFWQRLHVRLPEFPRDDDWWHEGHDLYRDGFAKAGFVAIPREELAIGDVVLLKVLSPVTNHGGVVVERGLLLHHLFNRLSGRVPLGPWMKHATHWLRYEG